MPKKKPDAVVKTGRSEIHFYSHYEEDPEKAREAREAFEKGLRYVAKQGGWLDVLDKRDAAIARLKQLLPVKK